MPSLCWIPISRPQCISSSIISLSWKFHSQVLAHPDSLITTVNRENMISYIGCMSQLFSTYSWKLQNFFLLGASSMTCCHLQVFALYIHHEQHNLSSAGTQFLGNWHPGHFPSSDFWFFTWISVIQMSLTISFVIFLLPYNFLSQTHIY